MISRYVEFRHVIRNVYAFNLRASRIAELGRGFRSVFERVREDLLTFAQCLTDLSTADETREA